VVTRLAGADDLLSVGSTVYVSLVTSGRIVAINAGGSTRVVASGLSTPEGMVDAGGSQIYVAEQGPNRVDRLDLASGHITPIASFPNPSHGEGIDSIHADASTPPQILVPDSPSGSLYRLNPITSQSVRIGSGLGRPVDAMWWRGPGQEAGGYVLADEQLGLVFAGAAGFLGPSVRRVATASIADDVLTDSGNHIIVTSIGNRAVYRYEPSSSHLTLLAGGFREPQGLAFARDGSLLISDDIAGVVYRLPAACIPAAA